MDFFSMEGVSKKIVVVFFLIKILVSFSFAKFYGSSDSFTYFNDSLGVYKVLFINPLHFLQLFFTAYDNHSDNALPPHINHYLSEYNIIFWSRFWNSEFMVIRFLTLFNIFTLGHYYPDAVFFAFISMIGIFYLYRLFLRWFPEKNFLLITAFLAIPSVIFFTSGIHKEAPTIFIIGLILWNFNKICEGDLNLKKLFTLIISFYVLYELRMFILVFMIPNLIGYYWWFKSPKKFFLKFALIHLIYWTAAFHVNLIFPSFNLLYNIVLKQELFLKLNGNTNFQVTPLQSNFFSLLKNSPNALKDAMFYPFIVKPTTLFQWLIYFEGIALIIIFSICLIKNKIRNLKFHPLTVFSFTFSLSVLILLGLIVPNLGAMVRYKSLVLPFLCASFFILADEEWIKNKFISLKNKFQSEISKS